MNTKVLHVLLLVALVGMLLGGCTSNSEVSENEYSPFIYHSKDKAVIIESANPIPVDMKDGFTFNVSINLPTNIPAYYVWIYPDKWYPDAGEMPTNACVGIWYTPSKQLSPTNANIIRGGWIFYTKGKEHIFAKKGLVSTWIIKVSYKNEAGKFVDVVEDDFKYRVQIK